MKLKGIVTSLIAGASLMTVSNIKPVSAAGACDNAPPTGDFFVVTGPDSYKIRSTVRQSLTSNNERKVEFAFKKLELTAQKKLAQFVKTKVKAFDDLSAADKESVVVDANGDTTEDSLESATEILSGISASADALLVGSVELGRCHEPGVAVMLTRGINSETAALINNSQSNQSNVGNSNAQTKTYRNDINQGYSGYGNYDNF